MSNQAEALFQEIYEEYYDRILNYIKGKVSNHHIAEDLTSDVFFRCYNNIEKYDSSKASVSTWIFTITNNRLKNYYRDRKITSSIDVMEEEGFEVPYEDDFDQAMRLEEIRQYLDGALAQLDETKRQILVMRYYQDMKTGDIAEALGLTPSNVRVTLSRLLNRLRIDAEDSELLRVL